MKCKKLVLAVLCSVAMACMVWGLAACGKKEQDPPKTEYTVSFETFGGTELDPVKVEEGGTVSRPSDPERYGYTFDGWFADGGFQTAFDFAKPVTADVTAYAAWTDVTYLYLYYGEYGTDFKRFTYHAGDTVTLAGLGELYTPAPLTLEGVSCPFLHWRYEEYYDPAMAEVTEDIAIGNRHVLLVAVYDTSGVPPKKYLEEQPDGSWKSTGNVVWPFLNTEEAPAAFSVQTTVSKGGSGGAGVAFRITHSGADYAYEGSGTGYLAAVIVPSSGGLQVSWVAPTAVSVGSAAPATWHAITTVAHASLPAAFREKWADAITRVTVEVGVVYEATGFRIYLDGDLAYTYTAGTANVPYETYTGTGYGVRSSHTGALFSDPTLHGEKSITFNTMGGNPQSGVTHLYGALALPTPTNPDESLVFGGWYYDEACEKPVDLTKPYLETEEDEVTLYAGWTQEYITVSFEPNGGSPCESVKYTGGRLQLPTPKYTNRILEGWYYDEDLERRVDPEHPEITENTTLYAAWRYPLANVTESNGTYSNTKGVHAFLMGETTARVVEYSVEMTIVKNGAGGGGLFFRGNVDADYATEATSRYIAATVTLEGKLQPVMVNYAFAHCKDLELPGGNKQNGPLALNLLPEAWQQKWNAAGDKTAVSLVITVRDFEDRFEIYLDGALACTYRYTAADLTTYTAYGYGFRATQPGYTWHAIQTTPGYSVTYSYEGGTKTEVLKEGAALAFTPPAKGVTGDNETGWFANAFSGWYTAAEGGEPVETVTGDCTVYAHYEQSQVYKVEFVPENGSETTSVYLPAGSEVQFPTVTKANDKADGFECVYTFRGWLMGGQEYTSYTVTADKGNTLTFTAQYDKKRTINEVVVTTDEDGDVYTSGNRGSLQGFIVPDHEMAEGGEFSYEITYTKGTAAFNHRTAFFMQDAGLANITGNGEQGYIFINVQLNSGTIIFGKKIRGSSKNVMEIGYKSIQDCAYKTKFDAAQAGTEVTFSVRVQFGKGWVKYWMEDCLLFTYCAEAGGETNYGATWTEENASSAPDFIEWINNPEGTRVGFIQWEKIANVGGQVVIRKLQYKTLEEIGKATAIAAEPTVTPFIKKKEEV